MAAVGLNVTRPVNDWCADGSDPAPPGPGGTAQAAVRRALPLPRAGTTGAPSTPRCTHSTSGSTAPRSRCATRRASTAACPARRTHTRGRLGAYQAQYVVTTRRSSTSPRNRNGCSTDEAERYRRGVEDEPRAGCCPASVRRGQQLDEGLPEGVRGPGRRRAAERRRGQAPRRLAAAQRHRGGHAAQQRVLQRPELRQGLVRRLDGSGAPRARRHGAEHRPRRLRPDQHPLRASRGVEPRLPLGRRHC